MQSITLYFRQGSSDKVYQAAIEPKDDGYVVNIAYGRRGSALTTGTKTNAPLSLAEAQRIYGKLVAEKTAKGYTPGKSGTPYQHTEKAKQISGILPQLLNPISTEELEIYLDDPDHVMQEKYDGRRLLIQKQGQEIRGINRQGLFVGMPEKVLESVRRYHGDFLLDGETLGDTLYVFDLLSVDGCELRDCPYLDRLARLINWLATFRHPRVWLVKTAYQSADKRALLEKLKRESKEGVVFKSVQALYTAGRPASLGPQLKYKFYETASLIVGFVNAKRSVALQLIREGKPVPAGNVTIPAGEAIPVPGQVVDCRYLYAFRESGCLYQPAYLGVREDTDASECLVEQLKYKALP